MQSILFRNFYEALHATIYLIPFRQSHLVLQCNEPRYKNIIYMLMSIVSKRFPMGLQKL